MKIIFNKLIYSLDSLHKSKNDWSDYIKSCEIVELDNEYLLNIKMEKEEYIQDFINYIIDVNAI